METTVNYSASVNKSYRPMMTAFETFRMYDVNVEVIKIVDVNDTNYLVSATEGNLLYHLAHLTISY